MSAIIQRDYEMMLDGIGRLYECEGLDHFPITALTEILKLVGADSSTFNYLAPSVPKVVTVATPVIPDQDRRTQTFAQYLPQHSALNHYLATGDPSAFNLSDFQSEREYHTLPLYQEFYRDLQYEDQMTIMLFLPGTELIGFSFARDRRSFTERDRQLLNLVRPHVARAYRHVERMTLLNRALSCRNVMPSATRVTSIRLDAKDRPVQFATQAQQWINQFFPGRPRNLSRLPKPITDWLRSCGIGKGARLTPGQRRGAMVRERAGQRLRLSVFPAAPGAGRILVLGLETLSVKAHSVQAHGLTPREVEVLLQVEQGKTNGEVAAALGISPLTVRCHLEHIFEKLQVPSRTAAAICFRRLCSEAHANGLNRE